MAENPFPIKRFLAPKYWPTWLLLGLLRVIGLLPLPVVALLGQGVGLICYWVIGSRRKVALKNIQSCFPEKSLQECRRINRQHFCLTGQTAFAVPMNWWMSKKRFLSLVEIKGRQHYDQALQEGRNIILLAPHFIGLDIGGYALAPEREMVSMYQYAKNQLMDEVVKRGRSRFGGLMVERKAPLRSLIRLIRKGSPFYYLPDQDAGRKGIFVPFFHELASTIPTLGKFAQMGDAVVIPFRTVIKPWGLGYEAILGTPIDNFPSGDEVQDTSKMNQVIAEMIRLAPEQYFWAHKRFKTRPEGVAKFYN